MPLALLDLATVSSLVRLRLMLDDALRRVQDASETGRHLSVVALDGAVEHALWLACGHLGTQPKEQATFEQLREKLSGALAAQGRAPWRPAGTPRVLQLRRARNLAQHTAV